MKTDNREWGFPLSNDGKSSLSTKDVDSIVENLFRADDEYKEFRNKDIKILAHDIKSVEQVIQDLAKSEFPKPVTLLKIMNKINAKFATNFLKPYMITHAFKVLDVDWHKEVNKKLGLYNYDFLKYSEQVKDETHKKQCLAMAYLKEGKTYAEIERILNVKPIIIRKWLISFVAKAKK